MEIQPNTDIRLLHNVPLDTSYDHTIYFASSSDQYTYFAGLTKYALSAQSYQRVNKGKARVAKLADDIYDCNYMMFRNTSFGTKWFYAFITSIEYVNNETSEISYELDPMQTWWFDFTVDDCFVEREHPVSDALFENLVPENLELGDYEVIMSNAFDMNQQGIAMMATKDYYLNPAHGDVYDNVFTPLHVGIALDVSAQSGNSLVDTYVQAGQEDAIVSMYQFPLKFGMASVQYFDHSIGFQNNLGGYTPKNNKLFSYPYSLVVATNFNGETAEYRWEQWDSEHIGEFQVAGTGMGEPCAFLYPKNYRGKGRDWDSGITYKGFPAIPFGGDAFKAFWAQNKTKLGVSTGLGIGGMLGVAGLIGLGIVTGPMAIAMGIGAIGAGVGAVGNLVGKITDAQRVPPQVHGSMTADYLNAGMNKNYFDLQVVTIRAPFARVIDDYFTKYGYAVHRVKRPNLNSRPHWNFVKTVSATITGSIPADDMKKICSIFDNGITFWKHGSEIGNYGLDNRPS